MTMPDMVGIDASRQPVVLIENNEALADSRDVAAFFGKRHAHVLRDIRELRCTDGFRRSNFGPILINDLTGETTSHVMMTKDGFMFLVLGFGGDTAGKLKEAYINRFNAMLAELQHRAGPSSDPIALLNDPVAMRGILLTYTNKVIALEEQVGELTPKAEQLDRIADANGSHTRTEAAKILGVPPHAFCKWLRTNGWTYQRTSDAAELGYQPKINAGYLEHSISTGTRDDGMEWSNTQVRITPRGLTVLAKAFPVIARRVG